MPSTLYFNSNQAIQTPPPSTASQGTQVTQIGHGKVPVAPGQELLPEPGSVWWGMVHTVWPCPQQASFTSIFNRLILQFLALLCCMFGLFFVLKNYPYGLKKFFMNILSHLCMNSFEHLFLNHKTNINFNCEKFSLPLKTMILVLWSSRAGNFSLIQRC